MNEYLQGLINLFKEKKEEAEETSKKLEKAKALLSKEFQCGKIFAYSDIVSNLEDLKERLLNEQ